MKSYILAVVITLGLSAAFLTVSFNPPVVMAKDN
jgi:hypothetical protein